MALLFTVVVIQWNERCVMSAIQVGRGDGSDEISIPHDPKWHSFSYNWTSGRAVYFYSELEKLLFF